MPGSTWGKALVSTLCIAWGLASLGARDSTAAERKRQPRPRPTMRLMSRSESPSPLDRLKARSAEERWRESNADLPAVDQNAPAALPSVDVPSALPSPGSAGISPAPAVGIPAPTAPAARAATTSPALPVLVDEDEPEPAAPVASNSSAANASPAGSSPPVKEIPEESASEFWPLARSASSRREQLVLPPPSEPKASPGAPVVALQPGVTGSRPYYEPSFGAETNQLSPTGVPEAERDPSRLKKIDAILPYLDHDEEQDANMAQQEVRLTAGPYEVRSFAQADYMWIASDLWHYPLYFQDIALERYGHTRGALQPAFSAAKFCAQLAMLPYQMTIDPMGKRMYELGYYRPGACAPYKYYQMPWNTHAALVEAGVVTGSYFLFAPKVSP